MLDNLSSKSKANILRIIFVAIFLYMFISNFIAELNNTWTFTNDLAAFNGVIPSGAVLISNINWFFVNKYSSKEKFAKWSVFVFALAYIIGILCGFIHYEVPFDFGAFGFYTYLLGLGMLLSVLFGMLIFVLSNLYFKWYKKQS